MNKKELNVKETNMINGGSNPLWEEHVNWHCYNCGKSFNPNKVSPNYYDGHELCDDCYKLYLSSKNLSPIPSDLKL